MSLRERRDDLVDAAVADGSPPTPRPGRLKESDRPTWAAERNDSDDDAFPIPGFLVESVRRTETGRPVVVAEPAPVSLSILSVDPPRFIETLPAAATFGLTVRLNESVFFGWLPLFAASPPRCSRLKDSVRLTADFPAVVALASVPPLDFRPELAPKESVLVIIWPEPPPAGRGGVVLSPPPPPPPVRLKELLRPTRLLAEPEGRTDEFLFPTAAESIVRWSWLAEPTRLTDSALWGWALPEPSVGCLTESALLSQYCV